MPGITWDKKDYFYISTVNSPVFIDKSKTGVHPPIC